MIPLQRAALAALLSLACACGDKAEDVDDFDSSEGGDGADGLDGGEGGDGADGGEGDAPDVRSSTDTIDFGGVDVGDRAAATVELFNDGGRDLQIADIFLADSAADLEVGAPTSVLVRAGGSVSFAVTYTPASPGPMAVDLGVQTNDPDQPSLVIPVTGEALGPVISLSPVEHDFGTLYVGCEATQAITIENNGTADLVVSTIEYNTGSADLSIDTAGLGGLPLTIAPAGSMAVPVIYAPGDEYADVGYLVIESDDPYTPVVTTLQQGAGELWGSSTDVFEQPLTPTDTFPLSATPVQSTLTVRVDGVTTTVGWSYDASANAVVFSSAHVPEGGSTIEVDYALDGCAR